MKEEARQQKIRGCPFTFHTTSRGSRKTIDMQWGVSKSLGRFDFQNTSNLAYERAFLGGNFEYNHRGSSAGLKKSWISAKNNPLTNGYFQAIERNS